MRDQFCALVYDHIVMKADQFRVQRQKRRTPLTVLPHGIEQIMFLDVFCFLPRGAVVKKKTYAVV